MAKSTAKRIAVQQGKTLDEAIKEMEGDTLLAKDNLTTFSELANQLSPEEIRIIKELRRIDWGKLTVVKKGGAVVMITNASDIKVSRE